MSLWIWENCLFWMKSLLPLHAWCYTHALSKNTQYLANNDGRACFADDFYWCCQTTECISGPVLPPRSINRTAWGTKQRLITTFACSTHCISVCHILKAQHWCLCPNDCLGLPIYPILILDKNIMKHMHAGWDGKQWLAGSQSTNYVVINKFALYIRDMRGADWGSNPWNKVQPAS